MMRISLSVAAVLMLLATVDSALAQNPAACQSVRFSDDLLSRFPNAPQSCLDVVSRNGEQYAVIKALLVDVRGNSVRIRIRNPDGSHGPLTTIKTSPGRKVLINGRAYPLSEVARDQELTAYVRVDTPMIALAPTTEAEPVEAAPMPAAEPMRVATGPVMPHTASANGMVLFGGVACLAAAMLIRVKRNRWK